MICEEKIKDSYLGILDLSTTCKSWAIPYSWIVFLVPCWFICSHVMKQILEKTFRGSADEAVNAILSTYQQEEFSVVNFIYFANIVSQRLFEDKDKTEKEREYKKILLKSDFLLPDGIALQLFYFFAKFFGRIQTARSWLHNLNGTDFVPYFLAEAKKKYGNQKLCLLLYGTKPHFLEKVAEKLKLQGYNVIYTQDGYSDFDWDAAQEVLQEYQDTINILLVARSTPKIPLQELWTSRNYQKIQQHKLLVFNTGGLLDFIAGAQKRAPKLWRMLKLEWLYRLFTDPKRNLKKVLNSLAIIPYIFNYLIMGK